MFMQWSAPLNPQSMGAGSATASFTSAVDISQAPNYTLPANFSQLAGATLFRFTAGGVLSSTGTPTYNLGFYYGAVAGTALATTGAIATASGVTNVPWRMELITHIRTLGTSGTSMSQGTYHLGTTVAAWATTPMPPTALANVTVDTTAAKALTVGATCSASSASNTITCHYFLIEAVA